MPVVLLVDDYADALEMYAMHLAYVGHRVLTASNGAEALAVAANDSPDVILLDLEMSVMNGAEALRRLRAMPTLATVPIAALTSHAIATPRVTAMLAGFDDVITKPCSPEDLAAAVDRLAHEGRSGAGA